MMNRMASPGFCAVRLYYHDERREARSTRLSLPVVVAAVVGVVSATTVNARQPEGRAFCQDQGFAASAESSPTGPQLKPRDDGFRRPDFEAFRRQLQTLLRARIKKPF
jgi:hypothetical protein